MDFNMDQNSLWLIIQSHQQAILGWIAALVGLVLITRRVKKLATSSPYGSPIILAILVASQLFLGIVTLNLCPVYKTMLVWYLITVFPIIIIGLVAISEVQNDKIRLDQRQAWAFVATLFLIADVSWTSYVGYLVSSSCS